MQCREAAKFISRGEDEVTFAKATGDGYDLPYGCIFYQKGIQGQPSKFYMFWNPKGAAVSVDRRIQQVCYESENALSGNIFL